jgi:DUF4097 and DUF4098 domain-containing protein YvlB
MKTKRSLPALALVLALAPGLAAAQHSVTERRPAPADGIVEIENGSGTIRVVGWDRNEVEVTGTLGRGAEGLEFHGGGRRTVIAVETAGNPHGVQSDLEIKVPAGSRLSIDGFQADITVTRVSGNVAAESVNGSIEVSGGSKEVDVETVNGHLTVKAPATRVRAESVNGAVTVEGASGEVEATTVNGRLAVRGGTFDRATLETVNGAILLEGGLSGSGWVEIESVGGSVDLVMPGDVQADFTVSSFSGEIDNQIGPAAVRTSRYTSEKELTFSLGGGGTKVSINTLSGDVTLRKR